MAHFAQLDENNLILQTIVVANDKIIDPDGIEQEQLGIDFCKKLFGNDTIWKQTSFNGNFRVRYGTIGYFYDEQLDAFIPIKPFNSWILNEETCDWEAPIPKPESIEGETYKWNESLYESDNTKGWVLVE